MDSIRNIIIIGAGNVATQLGLALKQSGFTILQVISRTEESARKLAQKLESDWNAYPAKLAEGADMVILCIKDDAILDVAQELDCGDLPVIHTSGSVSLEVISRVSTNTGVLYPLQTISIGNPPMWNEIPILLEANNETMKSALIEFAEKISPKLHFLSSENRLKLHCAAVWVNNFTNQLFLEAEKISKDAGLPFEVLKPLAIETINKAFQMGPFAAQTGPALRNDISTIAKHLALLQRPEQKKVYELISSLIHKLHHFSD